MIIWMDGFDAYDTLTNRYSIPGGGVSLSSTYARPNSVAGQGVRINGGSLSDYTLRKSGLYSYDSTIILGVACKVVPGANDQWPPTQTNSSIQVRDTSSYGFVAGLSFYNCNLTLRNYDNSTQATGYLIPQEKWFYLEFKVVADDVSGYVGVRVNGDLVYEGLGATIDLDPPYEHTGIMNAFRLRGCYEGIFNNDGAAVWYDDLVVLNSVGVNNTFIGDKEVYSIFPSNDGLTNWGVNGAATNYQAIDERPTIDEDDYIYASGAGVTDTYVMEDMPDWCPVISGVQMNFWVTQSLNERTIAPIVSGASVATGTLLPPSQSFAEMHFVYDVDPTDDAAWEKATLDAEELGVTTVT